MCKCNKEQETLPYSLSCYIGCYGNVMLWQQRLTNSVHVSGYENARAAVAKYVSTPSSAVEAKVS